MFDFIFARLEGVNGKTMNGTEAEADQDQDRDQATSGLEGSR